MNAKFFCMLGAIFFALYAMPVRAGETVSVPICFNIINQAPYTVMGTMITDIYDTPDGTKARHRANFSLKEREHTQFCTTGPFYPDRKLELSLHTLLPIFSCMTKIDGDIVIRGERKPQGGTKTWAECRE
jgi:hypothetical protein